jgi:hypothetical protein
MRLKARRVSLAYLCIDRLIDSVVKFMNWQPVEDAPLYRDLELADRCHAGLRIRASKRFICLACVAAGYASIPNRIVSARTPRSGSIVCCRVAQVWRTMAKDWPKGRIGICGLFGLALENQLTTGPAIVSEAQ